MIRKLQVQNFRRHENYAAEFQAGPTIITGANGSGKTSLLEAIYIALQGKSWRSNFAEILRDDGQAVADWWRVDLEFTDGEKRTVKFSGGTKTFEIGAQRFACLPAKFKKPVVLFEPNDLQLLYGSPARRRDFFDRFIAQIEPAHGVSLRKIERVLRQRNNLLKRGALKDELFVWDLQFADLAEKVIAARRHWIKKINDDLTREYQKIAANSDEIAVRYLAPQKTRQQILDQLQRDYANNWPYTKTGPQTHDIKFKINGHDAKTTASRGESRTIIFALKNLEYQQFVNERPLVLLDDILSEFDERHKSNLITTIKNGQVIITSGLNIDITNSYQIAL